MPMSRVRVAAVVVVLCVAAPWGSFAAAGASCLRPPVDADISRPFDAPACQWCAGHRGLTYRVAPGTVVRAAAAGMVTFAGAVVDIRYVVVRHADGLLATYGGLDTIAVRRDSRVAAGSAVGTTGDELYFGLRSAPDVYIDPAPLIGTLEVPPYLVPTDGTASRPPPAPVLRCGSS